MVQTKTNPAATETILTTQVIKIKGTFKLKLCFFYKIGNWSDEVNFIVKVNW